MRILVGIGEIAGYYGKLASGLRQCGAVVTHVGALSHPFGYNKTEKMPAALHAYEAIHARRRAASGMAAKMLLALEKLAKLAVFVWAVPRHDVFIFGFDNSFHSSGRDIALLRRLGKTVICNVSFGSDSRPPYLDGSFFPDEKIAVDADYLCERSRRMRDRLQRMEKHASAIVGAPMTSHFLTRPFVNFYEIGIPYDAPEKVAAAAKGEAVKIVHAPSHPFGKGTPRIREMIARLKSQGLAIDYVEIINRPNHEVLSELASCDFVVDQLYTDTPTGAFATEAAWFGKPAILGSYGWRTLKDIIPDHLRSPSYLCHPDEVEAAIRLMVTDMEYRRDLGRKAYEFVSTQWTGRRVAAQFMRLARNDIPASWYFDPRDVVYVNGWGLSASRNREILRQYLSRAGVDGLYLSHRPDLEAAITAIMDDHEKAKAA